MLFFHHSNLEAEWNWKDRQGHSGRDDRAQLGKVRVTDVFSQSTFLAHSNLAFGLVTRRRQVH